MRSSNFIMFNGYIASVEQTKQFGETIIKEFSVTLNFKNKDDSKRTLWKNCKMFNKVATAYENIAKSDYVKVIGSMDVECWNGQDGKQHSREVVIVDSIEFVSYKKNYTNSNDTTHPDNQQLQQMQPPQEQYQQSQPQQEQAEDNDLPF